MANNIYDLAGNCDEWTQEAYDAIGRVARGGGYESLYKTVYDWYRDTPISENSGIGTRNSSHFNNKVESINLSV